MKRLKKLLIIFLAVVTALGMTLAFTGCGEKSKTATLKIVKQYGMAYAPLKVMEKKKLIEKYYDGDLDIEWNTLNSGAAITESFASGDVDVGAMGIGPAVTGALSDCGFKICSGMSSQPNKLMTNDSSITSVKDITSDDKIALVNENSFQHIILAMECKKVLGDAHALDENITAMSHPDGMSALKAGSVACQVTTTPYIFEEADDGMDEVTDFTDVWPQGNSFIVLCATKKLYKDNPELYEAVVKACAEAVKWINDNPKAAAKMLCEDEGVDADTMLTWLKDPSCIYSTKIKGVMDFNDFMGENGFLEVDQATKLSQLAFDNVKGN